MRRRLLFLCVCLIICSMFVACANMEDIESEYYSLSGFVKEVTPDNVVMIINAYPVKYDCTINTHNVRYKGDVGAINVDDYITVYFDISQFDHYEDARIDRSIIIVKQDKLPQELIDIETTPSDEQEPNKNDEVLVDVVEADKN